MKGLRCHPPQLSFLPAALETSVALALLGSASDRPWALKEPQWISSLPHSMPRKPQGLTDATFLLLGTDTVAKETCCFLGDNRESRL